MQILAPMATCDRPSGVRAVVAPALSLRRAENDKTESRGSTPRLRATRGVALEIEVGYQVVQNGILGHFLSCYARHAAVGRGEAVWTKNE